MESTRFGDGATAPEGAGLVVHLIGQPRWQDAAGREQTLSRLDAALLALLALGHEQPRDRLAAWLWPQVALRNANLNLRQRLYRLRRETGHALVDAGPVLRLAQGVLTDLEPQAEWPPEGELLGGHDYGDREALDEWLQAARRQCQARQLETLAALAVRLEQGGDTAAAIAACERLVERGPWHEAIWRRLMRLHQACGDRAAAIDAFERFERWVREEQGSRPSAETVELLRQIERADDAPKPAAGPLPASLLHPPRLIGRDRALRALQQAWQGGRAAFVVADAGMGKTRLIAEVMQGLAGTVTVSAQPGDAAMPYALAGRMLDAVFERHAPPLPAAVQAELSRIRPLSHLAPPGPGEQALLWQSVATALAKAAAGQGLAALALDDLQFADAASLDLLRWLVAGPSLAAVRLVLGGRPEGAFAWRDWLGDSSRVEPVRLEQWTQAEVLELLQALALPGADSAGLGAALHRHAGGHPYFTLETLKRQLLDGLAGAQAALPLPATVQSMIARRLAALTLPAQELLQFAAVAGSGLRLAQAARILGRAEAELAAPWAELEDAQVLQGERFAHDLVRQVALSALPTARRQALHAALAADLVGQRPAASPARVAEHWLGAGDWAAAAPWLRAAAVAAGRAGRLAEQVALLDRAADACRRAGDDDGAFDAACEALGGVTMQQGSAAALERIAQWPSLPLRPGQQARLALARGEACLNEARFGDALQAAEEALQLAAPDASVMTDAVALHGRALALTGEPDAAIVQLERALEQARRLADPAREHSIAAALAHALFVAGRGAVAIRHQQRALELARDLGAAAELAQAAGNLAMLHFICGEARAAWPYAREAERLYTAMGAEAAAPGVMNRIVLGRVAMHHGHFDAARAVVEGAAQASPQQAGPTVAAMAHAAQATYWIWTGQPRRGLQALEIAEQELIPMARLSWWQVQARASEWAGLDPGPARAQVERVLAEHPQLLDDPVLLLEWSRTAPAALAVKRLRAAGGACRKVGRTALARSLALHEIDRLREIDPLAAARRAERLRRELPRGLFASTYPPEAWWMLARALDGQAAADCRARGLAWLRDQALPHLAPRERAAFVTGHPVNRALWGEAALPGARPVTAA